MFNRLQTKLTVLYAGLFALALSLVAVTVYLAIVGNAQQTVRKELTATGTVFDRVWALRTQRLQDGADLLSRDFGFRAAFATRDAPTVESAITNLRQRLGLDLAFTVSVEGEVIGIDPGQLDLEKLWTALDGETGAQGVFVVNGAPYQIISAPILSPNLTGWIVFAARLDRREMQALERLSAIGLEAQVFDRRGQAWITDSITADTPRLAVFVDTAIRDKAGKPSLLKGKAGESLVLVKPLKSLSSDSAAALVLRYPMALAMAPYRPLMAGVILVGLIGAALVAAASWALSRGLARPIMALDDAARRLQRGETVHVTVQTQDEIGRLADSFNHMATEIRDREAMITHQALHDEETGLPNRRALEREITTRLAQVVPGQHVVVSATGLDRFTFVRSAIGYELATQLITELGARIGLISPETFIGRLTTSTLCVVGTHDDVETTLSRIEAVLTGLEAPIRVRGELVDIHMTVGVATTIPGGPDAPRVIEQSMIALDQARAARRKVMLFDPVAYGDPSGNLSLMSEMLEGVANGALFLNHQPKLDLRSGRITGVEALVRWKHPTRGMMRPDLFVEMAEETGHIRALTDFVLTQAIADQKALRAAGHDVLMSVNVSGRLIDDAEFADRAIDLVAREGARVCFEITETAVIGNPDVALGVLDKLAAAGIPVSIDDYGSGLSSLAYLKQIRADELKIDKAFVLKLEAGGKDALLVKSTVDLAHSLGMKVTAEGVETREALALLQLMGCDIAQGYHIARPMALEPLTTFLEGWSIDMPTDVEAGTLKHA
ncbi:MULTISPECIES: putative bifunctional diguanylate cyclase/phosphodiesterase [unclassified Caulobacter]|uniref:putative bifunctional diguanylate cyclase/phosphodiesterase n=1 Tax=unclassified Caulobacter TaxID=2648921 RepID=UPI000D33E11C|nr:MULTISPECIES: EAL domain-containing protein [unclassified Caulobacter]PTS91202.1 histidine kinase [Caulobacter sp. HMWF009]PTT10210.1 histidine kinase [Caulobacter sp. HMWF025]